MLRIALPNKPVRSEEKRNLILRIRYGSLHYSLQSNPNEDARLHIQGHSVACRSQKRRLPAVPDYGRRFLKLPGSKNLSLKITPTNLPVLSTKQTKNSEPRKHISQKNEDFQESNNELVMDANFWYTSINRGGPLEALHEHSDEEGHNSLGPLSYSNKNDRKEKKLLPEIPSSRKMSFTRRYSKESDVDYYNRRNRSRAGSISAWSTSSDKSQISRAPTTNRRRAKRLRSKGDSRRSSKAESVDLEPTAWFGFHENVDEENRIWFDYPGIDLTFVDVQQALEKVIPDAFEAKKVSSILFENMNVKLSDAESKNKWHVELSDLASKKLLMDTGLVFPKPRIHNAAGRNYCSGR